jgi:hypothetical protein
MFSTHQTILAEALESGDDVATAETLAGGNRQALTSKEITTVNARNRRPSAS